MAIIDPEDQNLEQEEQQTQTQTENTSVLPEKYRGKSIEDIVKMHQEAEALIGRQAQEVGEVRKLADDLIKRQFEQTPPKRENEPELEDVDFFVDPKAAVNKVLADNPILKEIKESVQMTKADAVKAKLLQKHPDVETVVKDPEFFDWVKGNKVRIALFQAADQGLDLDAADELFSNFKLHRQIKERTTSEGVVSLKEDNKKALKAAIVPSGESTGETGRKIYRRADLIRLQIEDPDRYMALQPEIMAAYSEGRVK